MKSQWLQSEATLPIVIGIFKFPQSCTINISLLVVFILREVVSVQYSICTKGGNHFIPLVQPLLKWQRIEGDIFPSIHVLVFIFKLPLCLFLNSFNEPLSLDVRLQMSQNFGINCLSVSLYSAGGNREDPLHNPETQIHLLTASFHYIVSKAVKFN